MDKVKLRGWRKTDLEPFVKMNSDPEVMRYFLKPLTRAEAIGVFERIQHEIAQRGWGVWVVDVEGTFAGMVGLHIPQWQLPFSPCTEILWRLHKEFWGRGIAYAAANHAIDYGFNEIGLEEIVAFTTPPNLRSIRLMERLGLERDLQGDFNHPAVPVGHPLRHHVLYRKKNPKRTV